MVKKYVKKPIPVEVKQFLGSGCFNILVWANGKIKAIDTKDGMKLVIKTEEGDMTAPIGSYIVKGPAGEFWFVKKEIFEETYEEVKDEQK